MVNLLKEKLKRGEVKTSPKDGGPGSGPQGGGALELTEQAKPHSNRELRRAAGAEKKNKEDFNKKHYEEWQKKGGSSTPTKKFTPPTPKGKPLELKDSRDAEYTSFDVWAKAVFAKYPKADLKEERLKDGYAKTAFVGRDVVGQYRMGGSKSMNSGWIK